MNRKHFIKVGRMLERLTKEIQQEEDNKQREVYESHTKRLGERS